MIKLFINNLNQIDFAHQELLIKIANFLVKKENLTLDSEINLIITNNEQIASLNDQYRNIKKATDVLSFPAEWKLLAKQIGYNMLGDIYISSDKVKFQAKTYGHSLKREWSYLFAHGLLHLLGYDHQDLASEQEMHLKISLALDKMGVSRHE